MTTTTLTGNPHLIDSGFDFPPDNPLHLLQEWLNTADRLKVIEPHGLVLSTVDDHGMPITLPWRPWNFGMWKSQRLQP